jgi:hypothetical protein
MFSSATHASTWWRWRVMSGCHTYTVGPRQAPASNQAAIAQLGERQTEDLKVPSSILGLGTLVGRCNVDFVRTCGLPRFILRFLFLFLGDVICGVVILRFCFNYFTIFVALLFFASASIISPMNNSLQVAGRWCDSRRVCSRHQLLVVVIGARTVQLWFYFCWTSQSAQRKTVSFWCLLCSLFCRACPRY